MARILSVNHLALSLQEDARGQAAAMQERGSPVRVAAIRVGDSPVAQCLLDERSRACQAAGVAFLCLTFPEDTPPGAVDARLSDLSRDKTVTGVAVLRGMRADFSYERAVRCLPVLKDVEAAHPVNLARVLVEPEPALLPPLCAALLAAFTTHEIDLYDLSVLVLGPARELGLPLTALLRARHAAVMLASPESPVWPRLLPLAEVVVAAGVERGRIQGAMISPGALLFDLGPPGPAAIAYWEGDPGGVQPTAGPGAFSADAMEKAGAVLPAGAILPLESACFLQNAILCAREAESSSLCVRKAEPTKRKGRK
ncbi:MAG: tetrahydrofolate dehydrogenase/cyclohydrolase catalytic domain-containing protein [Planctomycetota bacterium]